jgi:sugar lactone lactonase YvrE
LRRAIVFIAAIGLLLSWAQVSRGEQRRVKWIQSVYIDARGNGLKYPEGIACTDGAFVVADTGNSRLLRFRYQDGSVTPDVEFRVPKSSPMRIHLNSRGEIYFLDGRERRIAILGAEGENKRYLKPRSVPFSTDVVPKSFAIDRQDQIYLLDVLSENVVILDHQGQYQRRIPFPEGYGFFSDLAVGPQDSVYLLDSVEAAVYVAARGEKAFSPLTEGLKEYMNFPTSLTLNDEGVLFLVDQFGSGLALVGRDGAFLGRKLSLGWNKGGLYYPSQICISGNGTLFVADRNNSRVQLFSLRAERRADDGHEAEETEPEAPGAFPERPGLAPAR